MAQDRQTTKRATPVCLSRPSAKRPRTLVTAGLLATAIVFVLLLRPGRHARVDEQLRAIDAAHAVPDADNAALDYTRLANDAAGPSLDPPPLPRATSAATLGRPWRAVDFPQVAEWIEDRQAVIEALLQAGRKPTCWFPLAEALEQAPKRFLVAHYGSLLLVRAANQDLGEGRMEGGLEKLLCVFQMASHFRSQLHPSDRDVGMIIASEGLRRFAELVVNEDVPPTWLVRLEAALPPTEDTWNEESRQLDEITALYQRKLRRGAVTRLLETLGRVRRSSVERHMYLSHLADARAGRILLALRRYRDQSGTWPADLGQIKARVRPDGLVDPLAGKPFAYRPSGDTFVLYSVGSDLVDEAGVSGDDTRFWPP